MSRGYQFGVFRVLTDECGVRALDEAGRLCWVRKPRLVKCGSCWECAGHLGISPQQAYAVWLVMEVRRGHA